ncbi:condensation domain-containing protein, partial [Streptomyces sp. NPDC003379]
MWPLSPLQEGLLFHADFDDQGPDVYAVQFTLAVEGPLNADRLRASWEALLDRHAALRASFHRRKTGEAVQLITRNVTVPWHEVDLSAQTEPVRAARVEQLAARERAERFDLTAPPLLRLLLIRLGEHRHRLVVTSHHLLMDGWSMPVLLGELSEVYEAGGDASVLKRSASYGDYLVWLGRQDKEAARAAWRAELAGADEPTLVAPADPGGTPVLPVLPEEDVVRLSEESTRALVELARGKGLTVNTVVQGAWALVLARLAGRTDVVFGATVAGRPAELPGVESMIGLFINTLPVRVRLDGGQSVAQMLTRLQERQSALIAHQHLGLPEIQKLAGPGAVFDTLVVYENYPAPPAAPTAPAFTVSPGPQATNYPLTLGVLLTRHLDVRFTYRPDVFDQRAVSELGQRLIRVLEQMVADPSVPVGRVDVVGAFERGLVVEAWNATAVPVRGVSVPELFAGRVGLRPDAPAVVDGERVLSYGVLADEAGRFAAYLVGLGVGRGDRVAVVMERSADLLVALLGVWKAGAAYVPVDPGYPAERVAFLLADSAPAAVVCTEETRGMVPEDVVVRLVVLDDVEVVAA